MSLLSKLFGGDKDAEKTAKDLLNSLFAGAKADQENAAKPQNAQPAQQASPVSSYSDGPQIPAEPNQYNYSGNYEQYFESIFAGEFSAYRTEKAYIGKYSKRVAYTFYGGDKKLLVVELMSEKCSARKLRDDCEKEGVKYLRFYYDHEGWWNIRSYVTERIKSVL